MRIQNFICIFKQAFLAYKVIFESQSEESAMFDQIISQYEGYIRSRQLVKSFQVDHYGRWVKEFLAFAFREKIKDFEVCLMRFLQEIGHRKGIKDWQLGQAKNAVRIYYYQFRRKGERSACDPVDAIDPVDFVQVREKAIAVLRLKNYAYRTEETYIKWINHFYRFIKKNRGAMAVPVSEDVRNFLTYLALERRVSSSTQNQAFNALLFLCRHVIGLELKDVDKSVRARRGQKLPLVLSIDEMRRLIEHSSADHRLEIKLIYGGGLRLMEAVRLRVKDIDFESGLLFIREGKGDKDRTTLLPKGIHGELKAHLESVKETHQKDLSAGLGDVYLPHALDRKYPNAGKSWGWQYVFPADHVALDPRSGKYRRHHITSKTIQRAVKKAVAAAGIDKPASVHTLRHYAEFPIMPSGWSFNSPFVFRYSVA